MWSLSLYVTLLSAVSTSLAFVPAGTQQAFHKTNAFGLSMSKFEFMVDMPPTTSDLKAQMVVDPILPESKMVEVRYKLPFGLDVAPKNGMVVCNKDGTGGEKVGDVLRFTSYWSMGLPRGDGIITTAASFAGGLSWQCNLFDVMKASAWEEVVEALTSNVDSRTDEVVLIFERPLPQA